MLKYIKENECDKDKMIEQEMAYQLNRIANYLEMLVDNESEKEWRNNEC